MTLTFANASEAREISRMANEIWHESFKGIISLGQINYMLIQYQTERKILEQMDAGYQYGFVFEGKNKAGYFAIVPEEDSLFMSKLYLKKEYRGRGLGAATLKDIVDIGRNLGKRRVYLHVNRNNAKAIKAYESGGFTLECDRKTDIGGGYFTDDHVYQYVY